MDRVADAAKIVRPPYPGMFRQRLVISNSPALARSDGGRGSPQEVTSDVEKRVQMKEGEWTGNGSCGDSTAAAGAADR